MLRGECSLCFLKKKKKQYCKNRDIIFVVRWKLRLRFKLIRYTFKRHDRRNQHGTSGLKTFE